MVSFRLMLKWQMILFKAKYTPYESLLLKESVGGFSLYFALVSTLQFNFESTSFPCNYKTKHDREVKGYQNLEGIYLSNENYEGCIIYTQEGGMLVFMQGKHKPLKVNNYEEFLSKTYEIVYKNDYEYAERRMPIFLSRVSITTFSSTRNGCWIRSKI